MNNPKSSRCRKHSSNETCQRLHREWDICMTGNKDIQYNTKFRAMLTLQSIAMNQPGCSVNPCAANTFNSSTLSGGGRNLSSRRVHLTSATIVCSPVRAPSKYTYLQLVVGEYQTSWNWLCSSDRTVMTWSSKRLQYFSLSILVGTAFLKSVSMRSRSTGKPQRAALGVTF